MIAFPKVKRQEQYSYVYKVFFGTKFTKNAHCTFDVFRLNIFVLIIHSFVQFIRLVIISSYGEVSK